MSRDPRARGWSWSGEFSGAVGDLGIMLPLAWALAVSAGYGVERLFFLWGLTYVVTGAWFRVPVAVQPLKAMAVLAIGLGIDAATLSNAAVGYGLLFLILTATGLIETVQSWFSAGLVRGIQLGIGLVLARKGVELASGGHWVLGDDGGGGSWPLVVAAVSTILLVASARWWRRNLALPMIGASILIGILLDVRVPEMTDGSLLAWRVPDPTVWGTLFILLMLPQLPLTLGNAVVAANDSCQQYWPDRARRVSATRLGASIGLGNVVIGLLGGFPMCHGAGGIAAHRRFGGNTGRTTIILGGGLIACALIPGAAGRILIVPVPVLAALLLLVAWEMVGLVARPAPRAEVAVALITGVVAFSVGNLAIGLATGWAAERIISMQFVRALSALREPRN